MVPIDLPGSGSKWLEAWPASLALLALAVVATYHHTLDVPFYLDDFSSIRENSLVYRWQGFEALRQFGPLRVLGYASFALNYRLGHFDPLGYHLVNIAIHFLAGVAVYGLARGLLRTPRLTPLSGRAAPFLPLFAAGLFVLHPLQTQAVTYIVQRLASLAALLYLAALAAYVQGRLASGAHRGLWGAACLVFFVLALFTKENAATFPLALVLVEAVFFRHGRKALPRLAGLGVGGLALVWLVAALAFGQHPFSLRSLGDLTSQSTTLSRGTYLATQLPILWTYVRLFFWPVGLHLDYAPGPLRSFTDVAVWAALAGHLGVMVLALRAWRARPLVCFGLLFYYLAHLVESSIIPIPELAFEHRTYLPDLGLCLLVAWAVLAELPRRIQSPRVALLLAALVPILLGIATWRRNQLWRDPVAFWRSNVELAPTKARAWGNLGKHLIQAGHPAEGGRALEESMSLAPPGGANPTLRALDVANLATVLPMLGRSEEALALIERHLEGPLEPFARATLLVNRGNIRFQQGRLGEAEASYRGALDLQPHSLPARSNLASALAQGGRLAEAESLYAVVLAIDPDDELVRRNLLQARAGRLLEEAQARQGADPAGADRAYRAALRTLEELLRLAPGDSTAAALLESVRRVVVEPVRR